jgi:hypothetical protein
VTNLFDDVPTHVDHEIFSEILSRADIRIERIVSTGQSTPVENPHRQGHDEYSSPVRLVCASRAETSAIFARATMF